MSFGVLKDGDEEDGVSVFSEINITPLTDVFLVLLIIFMVTSSAIKYSGVKVNLPKGGAASSSNSSKGVTVSINAGGEIYLGKERISIEGLESALRVKISSRENKSVILAGDQEVMLGLALRIMNIAKKAGAQKFGLATQEAGKR